MATVVTDQVEEKLVAPDRAHRHRRHDVPG